MINCLDTHIVKWKDHWENLVCVCVSLSVGLSVGQSVGRSVVTAGKARVKPAFVNEDSSSSSVLPTATMSLAAPVQDKMFAVKQACWVVWVLSIAEIFQPASIMQFNSFKDFAFMQSVVFPPISRLWLIFRGSLKQTDLNKKQGEIVPCHFIVKVL